MGQKTANSSGMKKSGRLGQQNDVVSKFHGGCIDTGLLVNSLLCPLMYK